MINPLNAELNPMRRLLVLVEARHIVHVSRISVKIRLKHFSRGCIRSVESEIV